MNGCPFLRALRSVDALTAPPVNDIPGKLRQLADRIEAGDEVDVRALLFVLYHNDGTIQTGSFGAALLTAEVRGVYASAADQSASPPRY